MEALTRWIHLLALATYFGTTLGLALQLLPAAEMVTDPALQRRVLARGLRPYNVLSVGALGVLVISGASSLTEWKALLGHEFARLLWRLVGKLSLTFALILVATYVSFGVTSFGSEISVISFGSAISPLFSGPRQRSAVRGTISSISSGLMSCTRLGVVPPTPIAVDALLLVIRIPSMM